MACLLLVAATQSKRSIKKWNFVALLYATAVAAATAVQQWQRTPWNQPCSRVRRFCLQLRMLSLACCSRKSVSIAMLHWGRNHHPYSLLVKCGFFFLLLQHFVAVVVAIAASAICSAARLSLPRAQAWYLFTLVTSVCCMHLLCATFTTTPTSARGVLWHFNNFYPK